MQTWQMSVPDEPVDVERVWDRYGNEYSRTPYGWTDTYSGEVNQWSALVIVRGPLRDQAKED